MIARFLNSWIRSILSATSPWNSRVALVISGWKAMPQGLAAMPNEDLLHYQQPRGFDVDRTDSQLPTSA